jgi:hypothetical protein
LKYTINPDKLEAWKAYADAELDPITDSGGRITGYYAPTEFAGATSEAFATINVGTMAENEVYRTKLAAHPKHKANVATVNQQGAILSITAPSFCAGSQGWRCDGRATKLAHSRIRLGQIQ